MLKKLLLSPAQSLRSRGALAPLAILAATSSWALAASHNVSTPGNSAGKLNVSEKLLDRASWIDFDGDGRQDAYVPNLKGGDRLYKGTDQGFVDVTETVGLSGQASRLAGWQDFDGDGDQDLLVSGAQGRSLFRNEQGSFVNWTADAKLTAGGVDQKAEWLDLNRDARMDLAIEQDGRTLLYTNTGSSFELEVLDGSSTTSGNPGSPNSPGTLGGLGEGKPGSSDSEGGSDTTQGSVVVNGGQANKVGGTAQQGSRTVAPVPNSTGVVGTGSTSTSSPVGATQQFPLCVETIVDQSGGNCIQASVKPVDGLLHPLSRTLMVTPEGRVGIGTKTPNTTLHVVDETARVLISGQIQEDVRSEVTLASNTSGTSGFNLSNVKNGQGSLFQIDSPGTTFASGPYMSIVSGLGSTGFNIDVPQYKVHIFDESGTGAAYPQLCVDGGRQSANLLIRADSNNTTESDQPRLTLEQDGGLTEGILGYMNSTNNLTLRNNGVSSFSAFELLDSGAAQMLNANEDRSILLDGDSSADSTFALYDDLGGANVVMQSNENSEGGRLYMRATGSSVITAVLEAREGANTGANFELRTLTGTTTYEVDAEQGAGGGAVMYLRDGSGSTAIRLDANNGRTTTRSLQITGGSDLAEPFKSAEPASMQPGMAVCIDPENPGQLRLATRSYDHTVAGVVSGAGGVKPGLTLSQTGTIADGEHQVALTGRVYVHASAENGQIRPGDLLTTSDTPGHVMRATESGRAFGAVVGKAMTNLEDGTGLVLVLVNLQ